VARADGHLAQEDPSFRVEGALFNGCAGQSPGVRVVFGFEDALSLELSLSLALIK
jgi:hypothetical protein